MRYSGTCRLYKNRESNNLVKFCKVVAIPLVEHIKTIAPVKRHIFLYSYLRLFLFMCYNLFMRKKSKEQCDKLLSPIIIKLHPKCLLCGKPTQVAHHHCHKSKSLVLRHDLENLIPLCSSCHFALHMNESFHASRIVKIKGLKWFAYIEKKKQETLRYPDYDEIYARLEKLLTENESEVLDEINY